MEQSEILTGISYNYPNSIMNVEGLNESFFFINSLANEFIKKSSEAYLFPILSPVMPLSYE